MVARKTFFEDLILLACGLPWQVGVGLAVGTWLILHLLGLSVHSPPHTSTLADLGPIASRSLTGAMAYLLQFVIPPALLIGAGVSAWRRSRASRWIESAASHPEVVTSLSAPQFEQLAAEFFRQQGFAVREQFLSGPDGGVDVVLIRGTERFLVQCKHWRSQAVGPSVVRELKGVVAAQNASGGYVVTSGTFTTSARAFAASAGIHLIDGATLRSLAEARSSSGEATLFSSMPPSCPRCGLAMVTRTARRGPNPGNRFWGCSSYPRCHGTVPI